jgi:hypothetical protein
VHVICNPLYSIFNLLLLYSDTSIHRSIDNASSNSYNMAINETRKWITIYTALYSYLIYYWLYFLLCCSYAHVINRCNWRVYIACYTCINNHRRLEPIAQSALTGVMNKHFVDKLWWITPFE